MATQTIAAPVSDRVFSGQYVRRGIVLKTVVTHTITYFFAGMTAYFVFDYATLMSHPPLSAWIRPLNHPMIMAGPLLQPIRGALFGLIFYMLQDAFFAENGWLKMWAVLAGVGIFGTFAGPPGSIEGLIYSPLPLSIHLTLLPEVVMQSFVLSWLVFQWVNHPEKKWLNWVLGVLFALVLVMPTMGLLSLSGGAR